MFFGQKDIFFVFSKIPNITALIQINSTQPQNPSNYIYSLCDIRASKNTQRGILVSNQKLPSSSPNHSPSFSILPYLLYFEPFLHFSEQDFQMFQKEKKQQLNPAARNNQKPKRE